MSTSRSAASYPSHHESESDICSLLPSTSSMATASNLVGPGRVLGKYVVEPLGRRTEAALAIAAYRAGFGPVALSERIGKRLSVLPQEGWLSSVDLGSLTDVPEIYEDFSHLLEYLRYLSCACCSLETVDNESPR